MTRTTTTIQAGFSAVELLITLFIGVAFVATSYQLYSIVNKGGGDMRDQTKASNLAHLTMQRYTPTVTSPCTASMPTATVPANTGLANVAISVSLTCPYGTTIHVTKVAVTVTYNSGGSVTHAMFVYK